VGQEGIYEYGPDVNFSRCHVLWGEFLVGIGEKSPQVEEDNS